jgi:SepF-like predicted cell division protein (DUF552 family)
MGPFNKLKDRFLLGKFIPSREDVVLTEDYVEISPEAQKNEQAKLLVQTFKLESFESIKPILDSVRIGSTIAIVNMLPLKDRDSIGLKRVIDKLKKTVEANDGDIAAFGEHWLIVTPGIAKVYRKPTAVPESQSRPEFF